MSKWYCNDRQTEQQLPGTNSWWGLTTGLIAIEEDCACWGAHISLSPTGTLVAAKPTAIFGFEMQLLAINGITGAG